MPTNALKVTKNNGTITALVYDASSVEHDISAAFEALRSASIPSGVGGELVISDNGTKFTIALVPTLSELEYNLPAATITHIIDITGA